MREFYTRANFPEVVDINDVLKDLHLLTIEVLHDPAVRSRENLKEQCMQLIDHTRTSLAAARMKESSIDYILHAYCALLDETVLMAEKGVAHAQWVRESLQARYFHHHRAGVLLYEEMSAVARTYERYPEVLTVQSRILRAGFKGEYSDDLNDPRRRQLQAMVEERLESLQPRVAVDRPLAVMQPQSFLRHWRSPVVQSLTAGVLLLTMWTAMDRHLTQRIATLAIVEVQNDQ